MEYSVFFHIKTKFSCLEPRLDHLDHCLALFIDQ